ncbi:ABC transporter permease [Methanolacinia paynteri]|uniref:ABC transporter permease n=1 Tax=Methanolacinia paynteri TaxID=230356 RepID=UPI00064F39D1|nr:ABC transporter permease subunit [Methanolacinia paynteri]
MDLHRIKTIAAKEVRDHITSSRFLALLFLFLTICGIYLLRETGCYLEEIGKYASNPNYPLFYLPYSINIFEGIRGALGGSSIFGSIIAIALGFDLITKEKESGSLKAILSVPVYRDEIINGKALGGIIVIAIATTIVFILALAILLMHSIVPSISELGYLFVFWIFTILFLSGIFTMSLMMSTVAKKSGISLIFSLLTLLLITSVISTVGTFTANTIIGSDPTIEYNNLENVDYGTLHEVSTEYYKKKEAILQFSTYLTINANYAKLSYVFLKPQNSKVTNADNLDDEQRNDRTLPPIGEVLAPMWGYVLFLIAYPVVFFGIAYVKFMRMDLR